MHPGTTVGPLTSPASADPTRSARRSSGSLNAGGMRGGALLASWSAALTVPWLVMPQGAPSPAVIPWLATLASLAFVLLSWEGVQSSGFPADRLLTRSWQISLVLGAMLNAACGLVQLLAIHQEVPALAVGADTQVMGLLRQRNQLATLLVLGICALSWWQPDTKARRLAAGVAVAALGIVLAATSSRTGFLALILALLIYTCYRRKTWAHEFRVFELPAIAAFSYLSTTVALYLDAGKNVAASGLLARTLDSGSSCVGRAIIWRNVLELIGQRPWRGWGWGELAYAHVMADYGGVRSCEVIDNAHNLPLQLAVTLGIPAALLLMLAALAIIWRAAPWKEADRHRQLLWAVIALLGLHSLLEYPLWYGPFMLTACLAVWQLWSRRQTRDGGAGPGTGEARPPLHAWRRLPVTVPGALLLATTLYAAWDYHRITQLYLAPEERSAVYAADPLTAARASWLFGDAVAFAALQLTPLTAASARQVHDDALRALHYSPEPVVLRTLASSAALLGNADEAAAWRVRLHIAYPSEPGMPSSAAPGAQGAR